MATSAFDVLMFVPNIIGYARVALLFVSLYYMSHDYLTTSLCYMLSQLLDAFDGYAARLLNQATKFGAMLDQLTDRASTLCLTICLGLFYPTYIPLLQLASALDITAHWLHLHASLLSNKSHKAISLDGNPILRFYYTSRPFLFFMCGTNELFYTSLYLLHFTAGPTVLFGKGLFQLLCLSCAPFALLKAAISFLHLLTAGYNMAAIDAAERNR